MEGDIFDNDYWNQLDVNHMKELYIVYRLYDIMHDTKQ